MGWRPLFKRLQYEHDGDVLHEGVPDWLWSSLIDWLRDYIQDDYGVPSEALLRDIERRCRVPLNWSVDTARTASSLVKQMVEDHELALEVINLVLSYGNRADYNSARLAKLSSLEVALRGAGSAWRVADGDPPHLEKRVPDEVRDRYATVSSSGRAAEHIRCAWEAMYGRSPDPSMAYRESVRAVEAAAASLIIPKDDRATLGKMIAAVRDAPQKWSVPLGAESEGVEVLRQMMSGVWRGQHDRHGTADEDRPISVSASEAEAALHTAITLVHLFDADLVSLA